MHSTDLVLVSNQSMLITEYTIVFLIHRFITVFKVAVELFYATLRLPEWNQRQRTIKGFQGGSDESESSDIAVWPRATLAIYNRQ